MKVPIVPVKPHIDKMSFSHMPQRKDRKPKAYRYRAYDMIQEGESRTIDSGKVV